MRRALPLALMLAASAAAADPDDPAPAASAPAAEPTPPAAAAGVTTTAPPPDRFADLPPPSIGAGELLGPLFKMLLMLGVVVAIAYLTLQKGLGKLIQRQNLGRRVKVIERVPLDPKRALVLVEIDGRQMLLGSGEGGIVHLKDLPSGKDEKASFADKLSEAPATKPLTLADPALEKKTA